MEFVIVMRCGTERIEDIPTYIYIHNKCRVIRFGNGNGNGK